VARCQFTLLALHCSSIQQRSWMYNEAMTSTTEGGSRSTMYTPSSYPPYAFSAMRSTSPSNYPRPMCIDSRRSARAGTERTAVTTDGQHSLSSSSYHHSDSINEKKLQSRPAKIAPPRFPKEARNSPIPRCAMQTGLSDEPNL